MWWDPVSDKLQVPTFTYFSTPSAAYLKRFDRIKDWQSWDMTWQKYKNTSMWCWCKKGVLKMEVAEFGGKTFKI